MNELTVGKSFRDDSTLNRFVRHNLSWNTRPDFPLRMKKGSESSYVKKLQQRLKDRNLYSGEVNGCFDENTEQAVMELQKLKGLVVDGIVDIKTWADIFGSEF